MQSFIHKYLVTLCSANVNNQEQSRSDFQRVGLSELWGIASSKAGATGAAKQGVQMVSVKRAALQSCYLYRYGNHANHINSEPEAGEQGEILDASSVWFEWEKLCRARQRPPFMEKGARVLASEHGRH